MDDEPSSTPEGSAMDRIEAKKPRQTKRWYDELIDDDEIANEPLLLGGSTVGATPGLSNFLFTPNQQVADSMGGGENQVTLGMLGPGMGAGKGGGPGLGPGLGPGQGSGDQGAGVGGTGLGPGKGGGVGLGPGFGAGEGGGPGLGPGKGGGAGLGAGLGAGEGGGPGLGPGKGGGPGLGPGLGAGLGAGNGKGKGKTAGAAAEEPKPVVAKGKGKGKAKGAVAGAEAEAAETPAAGKGKGKGKGGKGKKGPAVRGKGKGPIIPVASKYREVKLEEVHDIKENSIWNQKVDFGDDLLTSMASGAQENFMKKKKTNGPKTPKAPKEADRNERKTVCSADRDKNVAITLKSLNRGGVKAAEIQARLLAMDDTLSGDALENLAKIAPNESERKGLERLRSDLKKQSEKKPKVARSRCLFDCADDAWVTGGGGATTATSQVFGSYRFLHEADRDRTVCATNVRGAAFQIATQPASQDDRN